MNTEFMEARQEMLNRLAILTARCGEELMDMHEQYLTSTEEKKYIPCPADIYRIGATLDILSRQIEEESDWYYTCKPKQPNQAINQQVADRVKDLRREADAAGISPSEYCNELIKQMSEE